MTSANGDTQNDAFDDDFRSDFEIEFNNKADESEFDFGQFEKRQSEKEDSKIDFSDDFESNNKTDTGTGKEDFEDENEKNDVLITTVQKPKISSTDNNVKKSSSIQKIPIKQTKGPNIHKERRIIKTNNNSMPELPERPVNPRRKNTNRQSASPIRQGSSIITFNPNLPPDFTEALTLEAFRLTGVSPKDVCYPDFGVLNQYSTDPEFREIARRKKIEQADELIELVRAKRQELIDNANNVPAYSSARSPEGNTDYVNSEKRQLEISRNRQRREVEQMLANIIMEKEREMKAKLRESKELERQENLKRELDQKHKEERERRAKRQRELEEQEKEMKRRERELRKEEQERELQLRLKQEEEARIRALKAEKEERERKEKAERMQKRIEEQNERRRIENEEKERQNLIMEELRLERVKAEQMEMAEYRKKRQEYLEIQLARAKINQEKRIEELKRKAEERDRIVEERKQMSDLEKKEKVEQFRLKEAEKMNKFRESKKRVDEEYKERCRKLQEKEEIVELKRKELEDQKARQKKEQMIQERNLIISRQQDREIKRQKEQEQLEIKLKAAEEREMLYQQQKAYQEREKEREALYQRLEREKKVSAALRFEKAKEALREEVKMRYESKLDRINMAQAIKAELRNQRQKAMKIIQNQKNELNEKLHAASNMNDAQREHQIMRLAQEFNIDIEALRQRVLNRSSLAYSSLPPLSGQSSQRSK